MTDLERVGGLDALRAVIEAFVDRMVADPIIGFQFVGRDLARVKRHELEHAARNLGGDVRYTGRPVGQVHGPLRINAGQFRRRLAILRTVAAAQGVPDDVVARWVAADQRLERAITDGTDCV